MSMGVLNEFDRGLAEVAPEVADAIEHAHVVTTTRLRSRVETPATKHPRYPNLNGGF
ncbi:hypothetical protein [Haloactinomyces albus]|uniref:Uncharacterized protein n=1 Tax=Haloactinomyces albus TaxID=1352928 RepID=A0AAE3ZHM7_9ACTN|nr:hypothetical protein [Haloactinomyces albus]MDR7303845.1 hypothetical protein [Haloactinomyces albus]